MSNVAMIRDLLDDTIGEADTDNASDRVPALERLSNAFGVLLHETCGPSDEVMDALTGARR